MENLSIQQKLGLIQNELKAKKNKYNSFGKYYYRNLESIYEGLKPLLAKYSCYLVIDNELEVFNNLIFRKSIATIGCTQDEQEIKVHTYTQEAIQKPGMAPEQCSGSTASYGDKYVLNKMFCLDDSDDQEPHVDADSEINNFKHADEYLQNYKVKFGKYNGKFFHQIDKEELRNFCQWLSNESKKSGEPLGDNQKEMLQKAREYLTKK